MVKLSLVCILTIMVSVASTAKILLQPVDHKGHVNFYGALGRTLQENGHQVLLITQDRHKSMIEKYNIPYILNQATNESVSPIENYEELLETLYDSGFSQIKKALNFAVQNVKTHLAFCREVMANRKIMDRLYTEKFDLALVDGVDVCRCFYIIPYKLGVPYITLTARHDPWMARIPAMPSMEGHFGFIQFQEEPGFLMRLANLGLYTLLYLVAPPSPQNDDHIAEMAPEMPQTTYFNLFQNSEVFLINTDNTCMDYPRVSGPHYHFIGGAGAQEPRPLPKEFADFVATADEGLIVVSFGSLVKRAPDDIMEKLMAAFRKLPQKVVMRYEGNWPDVPQNVMLTKWLPQNDLLGNKKTVLYIAHGGNNGQTEGHYHGVPMLVMPMAGDQIYSAKRVEFKQYGKSVNPMDFTSDELLKTIDEILTNPIYRTNIEKCSGIIKSFPSSHDAVLFWVDHILKFGGQHLKPAHMDMSIYKVFMLDVLLVLLLLAVGLLYCMATCCCWANRRCCGTGKKDKKD